MTWKELRLSRVFFLLFCLLNGSIIAYGQELSPCRERAHTLNEPWINGSLFCLEEVIHDRSAGELSFTALATSPDGTLFAARPLSGQVLALEDTDGDSLPDTPYVIADGLTLPNGLAYHEGALYVSGGAYVYRLIEDTLEVLVDDLPSGAGFWTGGLVVGPDERLYVATGAPCDFCEFADAQRGAILSFTLDGSDRQLVATGLRQPTDLAFINQTLWAVDTARDALFDTPHLDELNRVTPGAHFGFPYCVGHTSPDLPTDTFDCADASGPAFTFPTHSSPQGMATYTSTTFPTLTNKLLVVLSGSYNQARLHGWAVIAVSFDASGNPTTYDQLIPFMGATENIPGISEQVIQYNGAGFWPHRPLDVAVSAEGWVYVSVSGGRILALRPR
jgi:glucose/arabinose dehydrogenase